MLKNGNSYEQPVKPCSCGRRTQGTSTDSWKRALTGQGRAMAETNTIYNASGEVIGIFRFGVAWRKEPLQRLGEYDKANIYDNNRSLLATFDGRFVSSTDGSVLGEVRERKESTVYALLVNGEPMGECVGDDYAGAAAIAYFFGGFGLPPLDQQTLRRS